MSRCARIAWAPLHHEGYVANTGTPTAPIEPTTDRGVYAALLEACVQAEASDHQQLARLLRAWVDASPYCGCISCSGHPRLFAHEPPCEVCEGRGFVSEDEHHALYAKRQGGARHGQKVTARREGL